MSMMMEVSLLVAVLVSAVAAQNEVPIHHQQQQGVPIQNQGHQQVQLDQVQQQQQEQLRQQNILVQQQQKQQGQATMINSQGGRNLIRDKTHIQDREHMMHDLEGIIEVGSRLQEMSEEEIHFHYFKLHDTDHNNRLDGLEILQAVSHFDRSRDAHPEKERRVQSEEELEDLVNRVLDDDDRNNDGYIDYPEFSKSLLYKTSL